jgi:hypothetical protein
MQNECVTVVVDVDCEWFRNPPRYRCYVNDELFTERTWIWSDMYLEESLVIQGAPGTYQVRYELVDADSDVKLNISNYKIQSGSGTVDQNGCVTIQESVNENT